MGSGDDEHPINAIECTPPIALLCEVTLDQLNTKAAEGLGACRIANQRNGFLPGRGQLAEDLTACDS